MNGDRTAALERLEAFVGTWTVEAAVPNHPSKGQAQWEWTLNRQFLVQRSEMSDPVPDSYSIVAVNPEGHGYTQHYFDARGITRVYAMTFDGHTWTLVRDQPDFTPLEFSQRFTATLEDGDPAIRGAWEISHDGKRWEHDFDVIYRR
jgi:hypothetical protein